MRLSAKLDFKKLLQFALGLLMFVVILDPTNTILGLKEILFAFVIAVAAIDYKSQNIPPVIVMFLIVIFISFTFSSLMGNVVGYDFDNDIFVGYIKSFLFLLLLLITGNRKLDFFKTLTFPSILISVIVIIAFITLSIFPTIGTAIYMYVTDKNETIIMSMRNFIGIPVQSVFYKSSPVLVIPLAYYFNLFLKNKAKRKYHLFISLLFLTTLLMSGTRANMLCGAVSVLVLLAWTLKRSRLGVLMLLPTAAVIIIATSTLVYKLMSDSGEKSNQIKSSLFTSLTEQIVSNPDIILFGQGPGSVYDSGSAAHGVTAISELSYLEIIRMFGIFGGGFLIALFFYPLFLLYRNKPPNYKAFGFGYVLYLFIGGTNPLLIGSTGFMVLAVAYSFALKQNENRLCAQ